MFCLYVLSMLSSYNLVVGHCSPLCSRYNFTFFFFLVNQFLSLSPNSGLFIIIYITVQSNVLSFIVIVVKIAYFLTFGVTSPFTCVSCFIWYPLFLFMYILYSVEWRSRPVSYSYPIRLNIAICTSRIRLRVTITKLHQICGLDQIGDVNI